MTDKDYAQASPPGPISKKLASLPKDQHAECIARELAIVWANKSLSFDHQGIVVNLLGYPSVLADSHLVVFIESASKNGVPLKIESDHKYTWHYPYFQIPDGTWTRVGKVDHQNVREDPETALKDQIVSVLIGTQ